MLRQDIVLFSSVFSFLLHFTSFLYLINRVRVHIRRFLLKTCQRFFFFFFFSFSFRVSSSLQLRFSLSRESSLALYCLDLAFEVGEVYKLPQLGYE